MIRLLLPTAFATCLALPALADPLIGVTSAITGASANRPLSLTLWYPATEGTPAPVGGNAVFQGPLAVRDGTPVSGPLPLVLISHGGLRSARNSGSWLAAGLAGQGMIAVEVAAPLPETADAALNEIWHRPQDLSDALTGLMNDPDFSDFIDPSRIGAVGYAMGGTAVAQLTGATLDVPGYAAACEAPAAEISADCAWFAAQGASPDQVDTDALSVSRADPRITAALAIDPEYAALLSLPEGAEGAPPLAVLGLGALPAEIAGAGHPTVLPGATPLDGFGLCTQQGAAILAEDGGDAALCGDDPAARQAVHERIVSLAATALSAR